MNNNLFLSVLSGLIFTFITKYSFAYPEYANKINIPPVTSSILLNNLEEGENAMDHFIPKITVETKRSPIEFLTRFFSTRDRDPKEVDFWWPNILKISVLRKYEKMNPLGKDFNYNDAFSKLDFKQVKKDMKALLTDSKEWWPADYGHYGPFFIRMAWHSAGTYRALDGRGGSDGGQQRFEPLNSWPDNANLDKARRLIQPLVDKYYPNLSWADAMILAGDIAMRDMGFKTLGVAGGRVDDWTPDLVYWGPEDEFLKSNRFDENGNLIPPLAASVMGLIYVNPEGPDGKPNPLLSAEKIRTTFGRMGMNDVETVALIAGGHSFGKAHGAHKPEDCLKGPDPAGAPVSGQLIGWENICGKGNAEDTVTSGIEGAWTPDPIKFSIKYLSNLYKYDWELEKGPGGKYQWYAKNLEKEDHAPKAHGEGTQPIMMLTTDIALKVDPKYKVISKRFLNNPKEFKAEFAKAWFKLLHRDLGPKSRYLGSDFSNVDFLWQDPLPSINHKLISKSDVAYLKEEVLKTNLSTSDLIKTAWASAASFRGTDMRGGVNGARIRLAPQKDWEVNEPELLDKNLMVLNNIKKNFNSNNLNSGKKVSLADLIVIAGNAAVEVAAKQAGHKVEIPFTPGRTDASQEQTDVESFQLLKVTNDGFRNYYSIDENYLDPARAFIDRANLLTLTVPEMTVLTGGLRVLGANYKNSKHGVFTQTFEVLSNDFFINLMDTSLIWKLEDESSGIFVGRDRLTGEARWTATTHDLIFGSRSELRSVAFAYSSKHSKVKFIEDFAKAWYKVMTLDRFDLARR